MSDRQSPRHPYLESLLSGAASVPPGAGKDSGVKTENPAIRAPSLRQVLQYVECPFIIQPLRTEANGLFQGVEDGYTLFYDHHKGDVSLPHPKDHFESLAIDVDMPGLTAGLTVAFNENTGHYQLDEAFVGAEGRHRKFFSCAADNKKELYVFITIFSGVGRKIIASRDIATSEKIGLRRLCDATKPGLN